MAYSVEIDDKTCNGYGNCVVAAPDVFDLDPETNIAVLQPGHPTDEDDEAVEEAEADCPVRAIILHHR
ncbi:ferredoxin [Amycolatopsis jiangsuensis]|uniref:Ferredoxin n=1 Tax=Amycolatopsis jiangsuensis TaxID=1181879 RepID=A0A840J857_9PSEU|nr:ferredoxin [Amycolatopsis jiangsuensis]MBB4689568.1 ferredoxin [Amycolatopsis jiangsuensis]